MKKLLLILILISSFVNAQTPQTGWNGAGFFDVYPPEVKDWLNGDYTLRYRADKKSGIPDDVNKLIELNKYYSEKGVCFAIIYCAGLETTSPEENIATIDLILSNNISILSIELDNEPYNGQICDFDFDCYKLMFEPLVQAVRKKWPTMPISYFVAPRPKESGVLGGDKNHSAFNNALINYLSVYGTPYDEISMHIYFNAREIPTLKDTLLIKKRAYNPEEYYPDLEYFYAELYFSGSENIWLWDSSLNYLSKYFPDRSYNITEFGIDESGNIKNTIAYHALMSMIWNNYKFYPGLKTMLEHNGNAKAAAGCITPASDKFDFNPLGLTSLKRLALPTWILQNMYPRKSNDIELPITAAGEYQYHFTNMGILPGVPVFNIDTSLFKIGNITANYVSGKDIYSSMGACSFMGPGTVKNYEITGIESVVFDNASKIEMPAWSYGYITFIVEDIIIPVECPDKCSKWRFVFTHWKKCRICFNG